MRPIDPRTLALALTLCLPAAALAAVKTEAIQYRDGDQVLTG
jgi:hypothetical protein